MKSFFFFIIDYTFPHVCQLSPLELDSPQQSHFQFKIYISSNFIQNTLTFSQVLLRIPHPRFCLDFSSFLGQILLPVWTPQSLTCHHYQHRIQAYTFAILESKKWKISDALHLFHLNIIKGLSLLSYSFIIEVELFAQISAGHSHFLNISDVFPFTLRHKPTILLT